MGEQIWYIAPPWMSNIMAALVWGVAGGIVVALLLIRFNRWSPSTSPAVLRYAPLSIDAINMANLRVAGGVGLGLVATCGVVAIYIPFIGVSLGAGLVVSAVVALVVIRRRRRTGPLSSSGHAVGAGTLLKLEGAPEPPNRREE